MVNLSVIETILRNRLFFFSEIRGGTRLSGKIRDMLLSCVAGCTHDRRVG